MTCQQLIREDGATTVCDRPLPDTALVCPRCTRRLAAALRIAVDQWDDLQAVVGRVIHLGTAYRPPSAGDAEGPACPWCEHATCRSVRARNVRLRDEPPIPNETPLPINLAAVEQRWAIANTVTTWTRLVEDATGNYARVDLDDPVPGCLRFLAGHATDLAHHEAAEEAWEEVTHAMAALERAIDRPASPTFAGRCGVCGHDVYANPGHDDVHCHPCGVTYDLAAQRATMLDELEDKLVRASEAALLLPRLGTTISRKDVDKWAHRGILVAHSVDHRGRPLYRVSEVVALANRPHRVTRAAPA